jgi:hypothetical protein
VARVSASGEGDLQFLGVPLGVRPAAWGPVDVFRVAADKVVEHWGFAEGQVLLGDQRAAAFDVAAPMRRMFRVDHWTIEPGDSQRGEKAAGPLLVRVDGGKVAVRVEPGPAGATVWLGGMAGGSGSVGTPVEPGELVFLDVGEVVFLPERTRYAISNDGDQTARLLAVQTVPIAPYSQPASATDPEPAGISVMSAAVTGTVDLPAGESSYAIGGVTLGAGGRLALPAFAGPAVVVVRAGQLQTAGPDDALVRRAATGFAKTETAATLEPGDSAYLKPGTAVDLQNAGDAPVEVVVVVLRPAPGEAAPVVLMSPQESGRP